jgi:hypothetical protein
MKFYCGPTQHLTKKPFPGAYKEVVDFAQIWPLNHLNRHTEIREDWESNGTKHRNVKINGEMYSSRVIKLEGWFIDFDDLDSLLAFCAGRPNKKIVIEQNNSLLLVKGSGFSIYQTKG